MAAPAAADPTPTPSPVSPAAKATTAPSPVESAKQDAKQQNKQIEIASLHTENSTTVANPDGKTVGTYVYSQPVRVKRDGAWKAVDTTLVAENGVVKPRVAKLDISLSNGGNTTLLTAKSESLGVKKGKAGEVEISTPSKLPAPKLSGNKAVYESAYGRGIDLVVIVTPTGFHREIVIRERPGKQLKLPISADLPSGMSYGKTSSGNAAVLADDKPVTELATVRMLDATAAEAPGSGRIGTAKTAVEQEKSGPTLVLSPDAGFLADPQVTYPVTLAADGTDWYGAGVPDDTFINNKTWNTGGPNQHMYKLLVGNGGNAISNGPTNDPSTVWRSYLRFDLTGAPFMGRPILNADLRPWNYRSHACGAEEGDIVVRRITSSWSVNSLSWSNQPTVTTSGQGTKGSAVGDHCSGDLTSRDVYYTIEDIVRDWASGQPNYGLQVGALYEGGVINWREFRSANYTDFDGHPPYLYVKYEEPLPREIKGIFMPYQPTDPTGAEIDAHTETSPDVQIAPSVSAEQAREMRANSTDYYMEEVKYGFNIPEEVTEEEWQDGLGAIHPQEPEPSPTPTDPVDTTPPTVTKTSPASSALETLRAAPVTVTFSEPVTEAQIVVSGPTGTAVVGSTTPDAGGTVVTFAPAQELDADTAYTVEVSGAKDAASNRMQPHSWTFTTETAPAAHWRFDEGAGNTSGDASGNDHDATLADGTAWVPGKYGTALSDTTPPALRPPSARAAELSAQAWSTASAEAVQQREQVEVAAETSETSITHALPDGSFRTQLTSGPVRTKQDGVWVPIDPTLVSKGHVFTPKAIKTGVAVEISADRTGPFVKMAYPQGQSYALWWPTPLPKPSIDKNVATFADAAGAGADLVVTVLPTGFRHDVVLRERPAKALELRIGVETGGLILSEGKGGRLVLTGKDKKVVASAPQPVMWDASAGVRLAKGRLPQARHAKIATDVVTTGGQTELVLKPDHAFLSDPATVYPVRVDPTVTLPLHNDVDVSNVYSTDPTTPVLMAGTRSSEKSRTHLRFDTAALTGATVTGAKLSLLNFDASGCGATVGAGIQVRRLTSAWDENNLTWANKPTSTTEDAQTNTAGYDQSCAPTPLEWTVTGIAQDWAAGAANHGLVLQSPTETNVNNYRVFASSEDTDFTSPPQLTITTSGPASAPIVSGLTVTPAQNAGDTTTITSLTPQLAATVSDTIGGTLTGEFELEHDPAVTGQGTGQIWTGASTSVASGIQATATVPAGKLTDGWKVRWRARAANAAASTTSAWSAWQLATVDVPGAARLALASTAESVIRTDQGFTLAAWLRWNDKDGTYSVLEQEGADNAPFRLGNDPEHGLVFTLTQADAAGATAEGVRSGIEPPVNEWFHLAGVYDQPANTLTLYLNGSPIGTRQIAFPAWHAPGAMSLGAEMSGALDEVRVYQKPLSSAQIAAIHTRADHQPAVAAARAKTESTGAESSAARKKFQYGHISTDTCSELPPRRPSAIAYTGSYTLCYSYLVGERDMEGPPLAQIEKGRWSAKLTVVMHSYVGYMIGKPNQHNARPSDIPAPSGLKSRQIRVQIKMGPAKSTGSMMDDWDDRLMRVYTGQWGCTTNTPDGVGDTVEGWADGAIREIILDRTADDNSPDPHKISNCSVNPNVRYSTHAQWVREDLGKPHSFRCDSSADFTFYASGCVLTSLRPALIFDENYEASEETTLHVWKALYDPSDTKPKAPKQIPGLFRPYAPTCANLCIRRATAKNVETENRATATAACRNEIRPYQSPDSCDEFPFATTHEGAKNAGNNYSVEIVKGTDNCSQGGQIVQWYQRNRMMDYDPYWVDVIRKGKSIPESGAPGSVAHNPTPDSINLAECTFDSVG
ncbi:DNRLRE domain-containing protein [Streptosporangium canum]|uniref:DNRLRE domain-containing protein n=1 Tax=Streptosporangium canum TaxID=324952 RepID=UPI003434BA71